MFADPAVLTRSHLLELGHSRGYIDHAVAMGRWIRVHRGVYVDSTAIDLTRSMLYAHLIACGPDAALSYGTASKLHGFDSTRSYGDKVYVTAPRSCGVRSRPGLVVNQSTMLNRRELVDGLPVTTRARTLLDISARVDDLECERVLESALRSSDPKRPDQWRTDVRDELAELMKTYPRHPGVGRVRRVLLLRPAGCRPTGSFPETVLVQALRAAGIEAIRQPTLIVIDELGRRFEYYPDLLIIGGRCIVEVDGGHHLLAQRSRTDSARQNRLIGFDVFRYPATTILDDPSYAVAELVAHVRQVRNRSTTWTESGRLISGNGNSWSIAATNLRSTG